MNHNNECIDIVWSSKRSISYTHAPHSWSYKQDQHSLNMNHNNLCIDTVWSSKSPIVWLKVKHTLDFLLPRAFGEDNQSTQKILEGQSLGTATKPFED